MWQRDDVSLNRNPLLPVANLPLTCVADPFLPDATEGIHEMRVTAYNSGVVQSIRLAQYPVRQPLAAYV
jgi:hypothetical protein